MQDAAAIKKTGFYFDVKWLVIGVIVAFLLIFQVFPLLYLVFRAFFSTGNFSLDAFKRVYLYPMNWDALRNTLSFIMTKLVKLVKSVARPKGSCHFACRDRAILFVVLCGEVL